MEFIIILIFDIIGRNITNLMFKSFVNINLFIKLIPFIWVFYILKMNIKKHIMLERNRRYVLNFFEWSKHWRNDEELRNMVQFQISMYVRANKRISKL